MHLSNLLPTLLIFVISKNRKSAGTQEDYDSIQCYGEVTNAKVDSCT